MRFPALSSGGGPRTQLGLPRPGGSAREAQLRRFLSPESGRHPTRTKTTALRKRRSSAAPRAAAAGAAIPPAAISAALSRRPGERVLAIDTGGRPLPSTPQRAKTAVPAVKHLGRPTSIQEVGNESQRFEPRSPTTR